MSKKQPNETMTKSYRIRTTLNFNPETDLGAEINRKPSCTVPDQNYTMREIVDKFTRGEPMNSGNQWTEYDQDGIEFDDYQPHPATLDLVDRANLKRENQEEIQRINESVKLRADEKRKEIALKNQKPNDDATSSK